MSSRGLVVSALVLLIAGVTNAQTPPNVSEECRNAVQGRIPWNQEGNTSWTPANLTRLCRNGVGTQPAICFDRLMRGRINWGGGTNWEWENAVNLCQGSPDANSTIECFESKVRRGIAWQQAINECGPNAIRTQNAGSSGPPAIAGTMSLYTIHVRVQTTTARGEAWDPLGGAPDISLTTVSAYGSRTAPQTCQDRFECTFPNVIVPTGQVRLSVFDVDLGSNDLVGECYITGPGVTGCGRAFVTVRPVN